MELLPHFLWAAVAYYAVTRLADVVALFAPSANPSTVIPEAAEIPDDLMALALAEKEVWAQEEVARVIREKYEMYQEWNKVRMAMGLGRRDDA